MQFNRDERKRFERRLLDLMASVKDERGHPRSAACDAAELAAELLAELSLEAALIWLVERFGYYQCPACKRRWRSGFSYEQATCAVRFVLVCEVDLGFARCSWWLRRCPRSASAARRRRLTASIRSRAARFPVDCKLEWGGFSSSAPLPQIRSLAPRTDSRRNRSATIPLAIPCIPALSGG